MVQLLLKLSTTQKGLTTIEAALSFSVPQLKYRLLSFIFGSVIYINIYIEYLHYVSLTIRSSVT